MISTLTRVDVSGLSLILLIIGMESLARTMVIGAVLNRSLYRVLMFSAEQSYPGG